MPAPRLFEFEDLPWFPNVLRAGMMDYLRFMISALGTYRPIARCWPRAYATPAKPSCWNSAQVRAAAPKPCGKLCNETGLRPTITLTDLYPQPAAWADLTRRTGGAIAGHAAPVNALAVPAEPAGFSGHLSRPFTTSRPPPPPPCCAMPCGRAPASACLRARASNWWEFLAAWTVLPLAQLLLTPFFRPFRFNRLMFTYLLPLIPLCTIWDGTVSLLRMYSPAALLALARQADPAGTFAWQAGKKRHWWGPQVTYLVGWPNAVLNEE